MSFVYLLNLNPGLTMDDCTQAFVRDENYGFR